MDNGQVTSLLADWFAELDDIEFTCLDYERWLTFRDLRKFVRKLKRIAHKLADLAVREGIFCSSLTRVDEELKKLETMLKTCRDPYLLRLVVAQVAIVMKYATLDLVIRLGLKRLGV